jgi:hypothetical protein
MRNTGHLNLDRDRDVTFDLFGGLTAALRYHFHQRRHRIRVSFDVELDEADDSGAEQQQRQDHNDRRPLQSEVNDAVHHASIRSLFQPMRSLVRMGRAVDK